MPKGALELFFCFVCSVFRGQRWSTAEEPLLEGSFGGRERATRTRTRQVMGYILGKEAMRKVIFGSLDSQLPTGRLALRSWSGPGKCWREGLCDQ